MSKTNIEFWRAKMARNVARDRETDAHLRAAGWSVLRFWQHQPVDDIVRSVLKEVASKT